jgi:iron complex outermembrane recepter protein
MFVYRTSSRTLLMAILLCSTTPVIAQDASSNAAGALPEDSVQPEIVVTGLSQKQRAQDAPVSVSVYTQQAIKDARINDVQDLVTISPSLSFSQSQGQGINLVTVRGITQVQNGYSPVAVIVDGVQQMNSQQFSQQLFDVDQIEVLRGPQGDLWGRNAIGGAIVINTAQPTNDFRVSGGLTAGNGDTFKGQFSVSGPIVKDRLLFKISVQDSYFGGLLDNIYLGKTIDRFNDFNARGHLKAFLTERLTADLRLGVDLLKGGANNFHFQGINYDPAKPCFLDPNTPFSGFSGDANIVDRTFCANNRGEEKRDIYEGSLRLAYDADFATITNVTAVSRVTDYLQSDQFPYTASTSVFGVDGIQSQWQRQTSWEDEFRITSPSNRRLRWTVGAYYLGTHSYLSRPIGTDKGLGITKITNTPAFNDPINPTTSYLGNADRNHAYALFGHVAFDLLKSLTAEFGYRYDWNDLKQYVDPQSTSGVPVGCVSLYTAQCLRNISFNQAQPKATLTYRPTPDLTFFTSYGVGFRSGQFNQSGTAIAAGLPGVYDIMNAEKAKTFEAGFKSEWLDRRLVVNASAYTTNDRNPAYLVFIGSIGAQVLVNIDRVRLQGFEIDTSFTVLPGLTLFANGGYTDSKVREYTPNPAVRGNRAPLVPEYNADIGAQYRGAISGALTGFARADVQMTGKEYWDVDNSTPRNEFALLNGQIGLESSNKAWTVTIYGKNLTNKKYNANYVQGGFSIPAQPRTFGAELRFNF